MAIPPKVAGTLLVQEPKNQFQICSNWNPYSKKESLSPWKRRSSGGHWVCVFSVEALYVALCSFLSIKKQGSPEVEEDLISPGPAAPPHNNWFWRFLLIRKQMPTVWTVDEATRPGAGTSSQSGFDLSTRLSHA